MQSMQLIHSVSKYFAVYLLIRKMLLSKKTNFMEDLNIAL